VDLSDLDLALALAEEADAITLSRFLAADLAVAEKPDHTPVSDADRAVESMVRDRLDRLRPGDGVIGEEFGAQGGGRRRWIVDPVDGTKNYVRGVPVWATLLGLEVDGRISLGVVSAPALARRWWAVRGGGAWVSFAAGPARRCQVSTVSRLEDASLAYSSLTGWQTLGRLEEFVGLCGRVWRSRGFGDFLSHVLVAEGAVDVSCEPEVSLWDLAALQVIVEEAGGRFSDLAGRPRADGGSVVASNGRLHEQVRTTLAGTHR
jgi:histidinol-phosphatase